MTSEQIAYMLEKTALEMDALVKENEALKRQMFLRTDDRGTALSKIAEDTGLDVDDAYEAITSLTPEQKRIFKKTASEEVSYGELSDFDTSGGSADDAFMRFMEN